MRDGVHCKLVRSLQQMQNHKIIARIPHQSEIPAILAEISASFPPGEAIRGAPAPVR